MLIHGNICILTNYENCYNKGVRGIWKEIVFSSQVVYILVYSTKFKQIFKFKSFKYKVQNNNKKDFVSMVLIYTIHAH